MVIALKQIELSVRKGRIFQPVAGFSNCNNHKDYRKKEVLTAVVVTFFEPLLFSTGTLSQLAAPLKRREPVPRVLLAPSLCSTNSISISMNPYICPHSSTPTISMRQYVRHIYSPVFNFSSAEPDVKTKFPEIGMSISVKIVSSSCLISMRASLMHSFASSKRIALP